MLHGFCVHAGYDVEMVGWGGENLDQSLRNDAQCRASLQVHSTPVSCFWPSQELALWR